VSNVSPVLLPFEEGAISTPVTRPQNLVRSAFHVSAGLLSLTLIRVLPGRAWLFAAAGSIAAWAWSMEIGRRRSPTLNAKLMRAFGAVAHAHESYRTNSSTWYVTALALMAAFAPLRGAELAVLVLGFGDPAAGAIGRRFGRTRISADRSLEGSLAFVFVAFGVSFAWLTLTGASSGAALGLAAIASISGALAEIASSRRFDDNFSIPVTVATSVGVAVALGLG
jgi:dolichol kinase